MTPGLKAAGLLALGLLLAGGLVLYAGPGHIVQVARAASPAWIGLAFAAYAVFFLLRGLRWKLILLLSRHAVSLRSTTGITAVGWLANSILPFKGGDVLRAALLARRERLAFAHSASTIAIERVLDLASLAVLASVGLTLLPRATSLPPAIERALLLAWTLPVVGILVLAIMVHQRERATRLALLLARPLGRAGARLVEFADQVLAALGAITARPRLLVALLPASFAVALFQALVFTCLVVGLIAGTPLLLAFAGSTLFLLTFVVSVTPGNLGTFEAGFIAVFVALGIPAGLAVPASILTHVATTLTVALLGSAGVVAVGMGVPWRTTPAPTGGRG